MYIASSASPQQQQPMLHVSVCKNIYLPCSACSVSCTHTVFTHGLSRNQFVLHSSIEIAHGSLHRIFSNFIWRCHFDRCHAIRHIQFRATEIHRYIVCKIKLSDFFLATFISINCNAKYTDTRITSNSFIRVTDSTSSSPHCNEILMLAVHDSIA